jgi:hypothetical protein
LNGWERQGKGLIKIFVKKWGGREERRRMGRGGGNAVLLLMVVGADGE